MKRILINKYVVADPAVCHGKPIFKGTRIMVWQVLELLETGESSKEIYKAYPTLPKGAIRAALHYAAEKAKGTRYVALNEKGSSTQVFA